MDQLLSLRREFPILDRTTYLVSNSLGAMPRAVPERLAEYVDLWNEMGVRAWMKGWWEMPVSVGNEIAPLIGGGRDEVAMFPNVSIAQAAVLSALEYEAPRDTIVVTALDFPSVRYVHDRLGKRFGARIVVVPSEDGIGVDAQRVIDAIDERTRLVSISHVLFRSAYIMDVEAICRRAREVGALVSLDAFHSVGVVPVDVAAIGCDFLTGGVLKWLCGGPGGCFLWVSPRVRDTLEPAITGWQAHARPFDFDPEIEYASGVFRWLNGTPVVPALYSAIEGPRIIRKAGVAAIREKSMRQTARIVAAADARGWTVNAPRDAARRGGTVAVDVPNGYAISRWLAAKGILVDYRPGAGIRIAPHFYTRDDEIDQCVESIDSALASGEWKRFEERENVVT